MKKHFLILLLSLGLYFQAFYVQATEQLALHNVLYIESAVVNEKQGFRFTLVGNGYDRCYVSFNHEYSRKVKGDFKDRYRYPKDFEIKCFKNGMTYVVTPEEHFTYADVRWVEFSHTIYGLLSSMLVTATLMSPVSGKVIQVTSPQRMIFNTEEKFKSN